MGPVGTMNTEGRDWAHLARDILTADRQTFKTLFKVLGNEQTCANAPESYTIEDLDECLLAASKLKLKYAGEKKWPTLETARPKESRTWEFEVSSRFPGVGCFEKGVFDGLSRRVDPFSVLQNGEPRQCTRNFRMALRPGEKELGLNPNNQYNDWPAATITKVAGLCIAEGLFNPTNKARPEVTLPEECRPSKVLIFNLNHHEATQRFDLRTTGKLQLRAA